MGDVMNSYRFPVIEAMCTGGIGHIDSIVITNDSFRQPMSIKTKNQKKRARKAARKARKANNKQ